MSCHDCLAELINRHVALSGAIKHGDPHIVQREMDAMDGQITKMVVCATDEGRLRYDPETETS